MNAFALIVHCNIPIVSKPARLVPNSQSSNFMGCYDFVRQSPDLLLSSGGLPIKLYPT
jgi:hypothetical protein